MFIEEPQKPKARAADLINTRFSGVIMCLPLTDPTASAVCLIPAIRFARGRFAICNLSHLRFCSAMSERVF